jgi:tetratricopeptide (TPR) repeat protein
LGQPQEARAWLEQAGALAERAGDSWLKAFAVNNQGEIARVVGDYDAARRYYEETRRHYMDADAKGDEARLAHNFAYLEQQAGDLDRADELFRESLEQFVSLGNKRGIVECLAGLAGVAARRGHPEWAARLLGACEHLLTSFGAAWWPADRVEIDRSLALVEEQLADRDRLQALLDEGRGFTLQAALVVGKEGIG